MGKVTIIGGGNGAFAAASDLTIRGNQVTLFELPQWLLLKLPRFYRLRPVFL